jgi:hypothetical protein
MQFDQPKPFDFTGPFDFTRQLAEARALLPDRLRRDAGWLALTFVFVAVPRLKESIPAYFDFAEQRVDIPRFIEERAGYLSDGEAFLAQLAFHLYNGVANRLPSTGLLGLGGLDAWHFELALAALRLRFEEGAR